MEQLKYCILSNEVVFGLNLVSKHCSEFLAFVNVTHISMKFYITNIRTYLLVQCSVTCYNFTPDWNLSYDVIILDFMELCAFQTVLHCCANHNKCYPKLYNFICLLYMLS
jgi:hypothetical protein